MKSIFHKQWIHLCIAGVVFLATLGALYWLASSMKAKEGRVIEARDHLASFEQNKRIFTDEAKELEVIKGRVEGLEAFLLNEASVPTLLSSMEAMAADRNAAFTLTAVNYAPPAEGSAPSLRVDFSATGTLANLELLAKDMLSQTYQAQFSRFSLYLAGGTTGWQLLAGIDITSF